VPSNYYQPPKPAKYNFDPKSKEPYRISRTGIELYVDCPRCFYLDKRLGVAQPPGYPFTLNSAVDYLLKKEFDAHRAKKSAHPLMKKYHIDAVPLEHKNMKNWRDNFTGVQYHHKKTKLLIFGAVDDIWVDPKGNLAVVDYKATSSEKATNLSDAKWPSYFRQMEIYQWLLRHNDFKVSNTGYFVYCNGRKDREAFDGKLEFEIEIISHDGNDSWVEKTIIEAHKCLMSDEIPDSSTDCDYCKYRQATKKIEYAIRVSEKDSTGEDKKSGSISKQTFEEGKLF